MRKKLSVIGIFGLAASVAVAAVATSRWLRRVQPASPPMPQAVSDDLPVSALAFDDAFADMPPDSTVFEPAPVSDRDITARPRTQVQPSLSGDDYDAIAHDELGTAFLARATDSLSEDERAPSSVSELAGFRIIELE